MKVNCEKPVAIEQTYGKLRGKAVGSGAAGAAKAAPLFEMLKMV